MATLKPSHVLAVIIALALVGVGFLVGQAVTTAAHRTVAQQIQSAVATQFASQSILPATISPSLAPSATPTATASPTSSEVWLDELPGMLSGRMAVDSVALRSGPGENYDAHPEQTVTYQTLVYVDSVQATDGVIWVHLFAPSTGLVKDGWTIRDFVQFRNEHIVSYAQMEAALR